MEKEQINIIKRANAPFTLIPNSILVDTDISAKAKYLYIYLFSKPNNWEFYTSNVLSEMKEGRDSYLAGIKELIDNGYITRTQNRVNGKFKGNIYTFVEDKIVTEITTDGIYLTRYGYIKINPTSQYKLNYETDEV